MQDVSLLLRLGASRFAGIAPYLIFFSALFFVELALFGISDALLGIIFLFFARAMAESPGLSLRNFLVRVCWFVFMVLCATLAGLHPVALVLVGALYTFVVVLFNSDDYLPRNYFWLCMGFLLLQVYPVASLPEIGMRFVATAFTLALTTAFVFGARRFTEYDEFDTDRGAVERAFSHVAFQLSCLSQGEVEEVNPDVVFHAAQDYAEDEYPTVFRQGGVLSGRESYTFALLLCAEQVSNMAYSAAQNIGNMKDAEKAYFAHLAHVFEGFSEGRINDVPTMVSELETFLETHALENPEHETSWRGILEALLRTLADHDESRNNNTPLHKTLSYRWKYVRENFSTSNTQLRFSAQLALIVGLALLVDVLATTYGGAMFGIWIPITAIAVLNTYNDETLSSTVRCLAGTLIGILVFVAFVHFIPQGVRMPVVVVLGYGVILMELGRTASMAAGTQLALAALYPTFTLGDALTTRLLLVVLAVGCVLIIAFLLLRTRRAQTIRTKLAEMERIDSRLAGIIFSGVGKGHVNMWRTVQLLYYMHMNAHLLERLTVRLGSGAEEGTPEDELAAEVDRVLQENYNYAMYAAHAVMLLDPRRVPRRYVSMANELDGTGRIRHIGKTASKMQEQMDVLFND